MTNRTDAASPQQPERVPSGVPGLDTILRGGFLKGGIHIIQGQPGAGKTILGNQICFNHAAAGGRALYVTLLAESHARMLMHIGGLGFFDASAIPSKLYYISAFPILEENGLRGLLDLLRREVKAHGATVLVLDGLVAAESKAASEMEFKKFIHELQAQATIADCAMFLLTSPGPVPAPPEHTMVDGVIELASRLYGWRAERDLQVLKRRGGGYLRGRHAFRITDQGVVIYPRIEALLATPSRTDRVDGAKVTIGIPRLDEMLGGGIPIHSTMMLLGPPGVGKTTLGLQFLSQCGPDEPGLLLGFYESPAAIRAKTDALGLDLGPLIDQGHVEVLWQPTTEGVLDEVGTKLLDAVRRRGVRRLFIDGLGGFEKIASDRERISHVFAAFTSELRALGVTTIYTAETQDLIGAVSGLPMSGMSLVGVSSIAENIVVMRFVELRSELYRLISALKVRDHRIDSRLRVFDITDQGIAIDDGPERAEAILAEATGQANGRASSTQPTRTGRRRGE